MMKKFTLLCFLLTVALGLKAQTVQNGADEPCNATTLTVQTSCVNVDTVQGASYPPNFTNSTSASAGVTLPALSCNGFTTTTRDCWYKCVVPASGIVIINVDYGSSANSSNFWDLAVYSSNSATCAGSTFTLIGSECVTGPLPYVRAAALTPGSTVYMRVWRNAASVQTIAKSFGIFVLDGGIAQPLCATPVFPISGAAQTSDPVFAWNNDSRTETYDVYFGPTNVLNDMFVDTDYSVTVPAEPREFYLAYHAVGGASPAIYVAPGVTNYWFVYQKNCATDPDYVPSCTPASYTAAPIPTNDNCTNAILLNELNTPKTYSSASSTESQAAVVCESSVASDVWFKFRTTASGGAVTVELTPSFIMDGAVEAFSGTCGALTSIGCADATLSGDDEVLNLTGLAPNTTYYVRVYNYDGNDLFYGEEFDILITGNIVIPVELVDFTAKTQGAKNALNWHTASERNAQSFIVERSADGEKGFSAIGTIKAAGTTSTPQYYAFLDENPLPVSYYRLRQVDLDGKSAVSKIVTVQRKDKRLSLEKAFPMPATNELTVQYSAERAGALSLQLVDVLGRRVSTQNITATEGGNVVKLTLDNVATGAYVLLLSDGLKVSQMRIVKQ